MGHQMIEMKGSTKEVMEGGIALLLVGALAFVAIYAINTVLKVSGLPHWSIQ
jgi:hypothetical protein